MVKKSKHRHVYVLVVNGKEKRFSHEVGKSPDTQAMAQFIYNGFKANVVGKKTFTLAMQYICLRDDEVLLEVRMPSVPPGKALDLHPSLTTFSASLVSMFRRMATDHKINRRGHKPWLEN